MAFIRSLEIFSVSDIIKDFNFYVIDKYRDIKIQDTYLRKKKIRNISGEKELSAFIPGTEGSGKWAEYMVTLRNRSN
jgi:hypothetical protein